MAQRGQRRRQGRVVSRLSRMPLKCSTMALLFKLTCSSMRQAPFIQTWMVLSFCRTPLETWSHPSEASARTVPLLSNDQDGIAWEKYVFLRTFRHTKYLLICPEKLSNCVVHRHLLLALRDELIWSNFGVTWSASELERRELDLKAFDPVPVSYQWSFLQEIESNWVPRTAGNGQCPIAVGAWSCLTRTRPRSARSQAGVLRIASGPSMTPWPTLTRREIFRPWLGQATTSSALSLALPRNLWYSTLKVCICISKDELCTIPKLGAGCSQLACPLMAFLPTGAHQIVCNILFSSMCPSLMALGQLDFGLIYFSN